VNRHTLLASTAVALLMCSLPASAQMQDKSERTPGASEQQKQQGSRAQQRGEPSSKGVTKDTQKSTGAERSGGGEASRTPEGAKGQSATSEGQSREKSRDAQSREQSREKGAQTQRQQQQQQKGAQSPSRQKGAETQPDQKSGARQGAELPSDEGAQTRSQQRGQGKAWPEMGGARGKATARGGTERMQVSEQQRQSVHQTLLKERNLNRIDRVNFSLNIGRRVPRSVRLAPLPASVIGLVPHYRNYRYFASDDTIYIIEPSSYEIVDVIGAPGQTASDTRGGGGHAGLFLTPEEQAIVLGNIEPEGRSTLGLGSLSEGAPVPRDARIAPFPDRVVAEVPKLRDYQYFTAEDSVAIVDPVGQRVVGVVHR
jgi:hypothetical protein